MKKLVYVFVLILFFVIIKLPYLYFDKKIPEELIDIANKNHVHLEIDKLKTSFPVNLKFGKIAAAVPHEQFIIPLTVDELYGSLSIASLLFLNKLVILDAKLYEGSLEAKFEQGLFSKELEAVSRIKNINLEKHPLARAFGLTGLLNGDLKKKDAKTSFKLKILDGSYSGGHTIHSVLKLPLALDILLSVRGENENKETVFESIIFNSSLGSLKGDGYFELNAGGLIETAEFDLKISLSDSGADAFSGYLALAARTDVEAKKKNWKVKIEVKRGVPKLVVREG